MASDQKHKEHEIFNPFPGLRPFTVNESHLFFGREGQSDEVLSKLSQNRFVAVIGASGSGKSSLIYCGLIPILHGGFITNSGNKWRVIVTRPGNNPLENLANSIVKNDIDYKQNNKNEAYLKQVISSVLRTNSFGLIEAIKQIKTESDQNFLVLIDQFEELFRFKRNKNDIEAFNESLAFVKLFLNTIKQNELPIYVVLTMRSDFIGDCSQFQDLTKMINLSHYLIPQMTRNDFQQAITGPVAVGGANITPHLVQQLLNHVGDNPDQLPILQHALMRTWNFWERQDKLNTPLDISHYEDIGTMEKALSLHANEAYDELDFEGKNICESMFKTLTEKGADNRGIRHPTSVKEIAEIAQASTEKTIEVINRFRATGRSFLTPSIEFSVDKNTIIDISHESLMRIWEKLKVWVEEESNAVQMYLRLAEAAEGYQLGKTGLWRQPDLQLAINWRENQNPTLVWAQKHNPAFERTMVYLETSEQTYIAEEENKLKLQKRTIRRTRIFAAVLGFAAILALGAMFFSFEQKRLAEANAIEAENQKQEANKQRVEAIKQTEEADKQREVALQQTNIAEENQRKAEIQKKEAERQKESALRQEKIAKQKSIEADHQKKLAEKSAKEALEQKNAAEKAKDEALNLRMLSISQSMAVKSLQINSDPELQILIALQAYNFNIEFNGNVNNPDIYDGIYYAVRNIKSKNFNELKKHKSSIKGFCYHPNKQVLYSASSDGEMFSWKQTDSISNSIIYKNNGVNRALSLSNNGQYMANALGKTIQLFDLTKNDSAPEIINIHNGFVWDIIFNKNSNELFSCSADKTLAITNLTSRETSKIELNQEIKQIKLLSDSILLCLSKNGTIGTIDLISKEILFYNPVQKSGTNVKLVNSNDTAINNLSPIENTFNSIASDHGNRYFATGDKTGIVVIWDKQNFEQIAQLGGHSSRINSIAFSPDNKIIATASSDATIRFWEMENLNNQPIILKDHEAWAMNITFSEDSKYIYGGYVDGVIKYWPINIKNFITDICSLVNRNLTQEEWNSFVAKDVPYQSTCKNLQADK